MGDSGESNNGSFCSGLIIVSVIMAILIFIKEFKPFLEKIPDFLGNLRASVR